MNMNLALVGLDLARFMESFMAAVGRSIMQVVRAIREWAIYVLAGLLSRRGGLNSIPISITTRSSYQRSEDA